MNAHMVALLPLDERIHFEKSETLMQGHTSYDPDNGVVFDSS